MSCKKFSGVINECKNGKKKIEDSVFQWLSNKDEDYISKNDNLFY